MLLFGKGRSSGSPLGIHDNSLAWEWEGCFITAPYVAFTDTVCGRERGALVTTEWWRKSQLSTRPPLTLLQWGRVECLISALGWQWMSGLPTCFPPTPHRGRVIPVGRKVPAPTLASLWLSIGSGLGFFVTAW